MAALTKSGTPSLSTALPCNAHKTPDLVAGEAIAAGDACYIKGADKKAWLALGDAAATSIVAGFAAAAASAGEAVTLLRGVRMKYAAGMTAGTPYYLSATVGGGLDTTASAYGVVPIARAYDETRLDLLMGEPGGFPSTVTSNGASIAEGKLSTTSVNLNVTTKTTLYTVPASKVAYITKVVVRDASTSLTTAEFGVGYDANGTDVIGNAAHTGLTGPTLYEIIPAKVGALEGAAAAVLGLKCGTAQGAAATAVVDVFGYLVDA